MKGCFLSTRNNVPAIVIFGCLVVAAAFFIEPTSAAQNACAWNEPVSLLGGRLQLSQYVQGTTVTFRLEYQGRAGWMGVGFGQKMADTSQAVIGLSHNSYDGRGSVQVYNMRGYLAPVEEQDVARALVLTDASFVQTDSTTTLTFTQPVTDVDGSVLVKAGQAANLIVAVGREESMMALDYHGSDNRATASITFGGCVKDEEQSNGEDTVHEQPLPPPLPQKQPPQKQPPQQLPPQPQKLMETNSCSFGTQVAARASCDGFTGAATSLLNGDLLLRQYVNDDAATVSFQLEYQGQAWIGVGFGSTMVGSQAVIGLPTEGYDGGRVQVYNLAAYNKVTPAYDNGFVLEDASIVQTELTTTLTFTMPATKSDGTVLAKAGQAADLIFAVGQFSYLGSHDPDHRGTTRLTFTAGCHGHDNPPASGTAAAGQTTTAAASSLQDITINNAFLQDGLVLRQFINPDQGTLSVRMIFEGQAWLGFGFSADGRMVGNKAVIGVPEDSSVKLYDMNGKLPQFVRPSESQEALTDASIEQTMEGQTILTFTLPVNDNSMVASAITDGQPVRIIYAVGLRGLISNLGFHWARGSQEVTFTSCKSADK